MKKDKNLLKNELNNESKAIFELIRLLRSVNLDSMEAELNKTSICDGKGGRILL